MSIMLPSSRILPHIPSIHEKYMAMVRKAKAERRARFKAAANEKDPLLRAVKRPFVLDEELR